MNNGGASSERANRLIRLVCFFQIKNSHRKWKNCAPFEIQTTKFNKTSSQPLQLKIVHLIFWSVLKISLAVLFMTVPFHEFI